MDAYVRVSSFWVIILTWVAKNKAKQKKQIFRVDRKWVIDNILNSKFICFSIERYK